MSKPKKSLFWKKKWDNKICGITKSRLRPGSNKIGLSYCIFLNCNHGFYRSVLQEWVYNCPYEEPTCPVCRRPFNINCVII